MSLLRNRFAVSTSAMLRQTRHTHAAFAVIQSRASTHSSDDLMEMEKTHAAQTYSPLPVVFAKASGVHVWDPEGKQYYDFLSAYSAVNQGHSHPKIVDALTEQARTVCLSSRAFYSQRFPPFAKRMTETFGYDKVLPMNTGAEAVETGLKIARRWGHRVKKVPQNEGVIVSACFCFHGRTLGAISMSCDPDATTDFGPLAQGHEKVDFGDADALDKKLESLNGKAIAFVVEPIQGEAGVVVPPPGYLKRVAEICKKHNVLYISDEVQTGIGRTGRLLCTDHEDVRPDVVLLGKALGGGVFPVSAVLADNSIMSCLDMGSHGSTFGGNPLACAVAEASLDVIQEEQLAERAARLGEKFMNQIRSLNSPVIKEVRGKGLLVAFELNTNLSESVTASNLCLLFKERGLLAKPTHGTIVRLAPPLVITEEQLDECTEIITKSLKDIETMSWQDIPGAREPKPPAEIHCERCGREMLH